MAICPHCLLVIPEGAARCTQCGEHRFATEGVETPAPAFAVAAPELRVEPILTLAKAPRAHEPVFEAPASARSSSEAGTGLAMPSLGSAAPSALTVRHRPPNRSADATLPPDGSSAVSVLESRVAKASPRAECAPNAGSQNTPESRPGLAPPLPAPLAELKVEEPPAPPLATIAPQLVVIRGERMKAIYPVYDGRNVVGRFADRPVDIDLEGQEVVERIRVSRTHAIIHFERGSLAIEDLNSLNGTWVNGVKIHPGLHRRLAVNDVIQIGTVQLRLHIEPAT